MCRKLVLSVALAGLLALAAACGGKKKEASTTVPDTVATPAAARQATPEATQAARQATATTTAAAQEERILSADCLKSLRSYRYEGKIQLKLPSGGLRDLPGLDLQDVSFSGAYVAPDREHFKVNVGGGTMLETITIGSETWLKAGSSGWIKSPGGGLTFSPDTFCTSNLRDLPSAGVRASRERVGGMDTLKYEFDKKALERVSLLSGGGTLPELPDNTRLTLWVTEKERWPVRMTLTGDRPGPDTYAIRVEFNVTDLNSSNIKIEAPQ